MFDLVSVFLYLRLRLYPVEKLNAFGAIHIVSNPRIPHALTKVIAL